MTTHDEAAARNSNGNGWTSLKAWSTAIGVVGIPGAIALFLVYESSTRRAELERQFQTILIKQEQTIQNQESLMQKMDSMIRVSLRACSNTARDEESRARCFDP